MQSMFFRWVARIAARIVLGAAVFGIAACSQERAPINRVQAMALDKHFFVGASLSDPSDDPEFYMGNRIIDEPYGVGHGFFLMQSLGSLSRVKWEIQENVLIARLTYDRVADSDHYGARNTNNGQVVAEFTITSHFDIIRDYNTQTGEQLNVFVENTTDRPWYEREYFRVDWSKNLVTDAYDFDLFSQAAGFDAVKFDPLQYYVEDPNDPNAPVFDTDHGYFDITNKVFATPQSITTPFGTIPICALYESYEGSTLPAQTCNPAEVTNRLSFMKVVNDDFEPEDWDGNKMEAFGWFTSDRYGYDRNYGLVDDAWHRFAAKFQIWQKSHVDGTQCAVDSWRDASGKVQNYKVDGNGNFVTDPKSGFPIPDPKGQPFTTSCVGCDIHRDLDNDGTEDECQFTDSGTIPGGPRSGNPGVSGGVYNPGSRCDEFTHKCDVPLYDRSLKTTPLYYGPGSPPDLFASTAQALNSWNIAVKRAAQLGKQVEANRAGIDVGQASLLTSEDDLRMDQQMGKTVKDVFVLCHNPVIQQDDPACGAPGLVARLGDLRYHMVNVIQNPQSPSPWGVMTDFNDPLTGEKVQASINVWAAVTDYASQNVEDLLRWINGEISNDQITNGQYMSQWLSGSKLGTAQYIPNVLSKDEIQARLKSIDHSIAAQNGLPAGKALPATIAAKLASQNLAQALGPSLDAQFEATRTQLMGSPWEAQLLTPDMLQAAGYDPTQPFAGDRTILEAASPLRGMDPRRARWGRQTLATAMKQRGMCMLQDEPEPDSLIGMARQAQQLFPAPNPKDPNYAQELYQRDQALHQWIREQFHMSVIAHEMGHSMGLRHNFTGSYDALNYHTEYWQLRTRNGAEHYCGFAQGALDAVTPHTNGADCVGPRWVDPLTDQETNGLLWKWASTTVMDYPGDQTQDMNDIGLYDKAAMRFGYANVVDVEKNKNYFESGGNALGSGIDYVQALDGFGGIFGSNIGSNHYSTYNDNYGLLGTCKPKDNWTGDPNDPLAQQCSGADIDFAAERDMLTVDKFTAGVTQVRPDLVSHFAVDGRGCDASGCSDANKNRVRHPYMFGSDEFADIGNVPVFRFDAGADSYEQMQFLVSTYENRYVFDNFRRNRVTFSTYGNLRRLTDRYWDKVQFITKSLALGVELLTQPGSDPTTQPGSLMPMALGAADGLAMFVRALTRPAPGAYVVQPTGAQGGPPNSWGGAWQLGNAGAITPPSSTVNVALGNGEGRFLHNDYDYAKGYWWSDYQKQVGTFYEKRLVPFYLTEAYNNFISNSEDDYIDGRYKNLNYSSLYPNQVRRIFTNLMATESATQVDQKGTVAQIFTLAPYAMPRAVTAGVSNPLTQAQYLPWHLYDMSAKAQPSLEYPDGAVLLDPLVGWETQYPSLIQLFQYGPTALNMDLIDQMRVFSPGDASSVSLPAAQQVRYRDPLTQIEYAARNYGTEWINPAIGFQVARSLGARMIQHANYLASIAYQTTQAPDPVTGELTYAADANGNPVQNATPQAATAATMLKGFSANLDTVRQLTLFFGYGPLPWGRKPLGNP